MFQMTSEEFEQCVDEAIDKIPEGVFATLENVFIDFEDDPSPEHRARLRPGCTLLGLYKGVPKPKRGTGYGMGQMPDQIWLFRNPIKLVSDSRDQVVEQIRKTLMHEIGHHNGMTDAELRAKGY